MGDTRRASLDALPFEVALERLEELVGRLEGGDLQLEEALASFEEGVRLTRHCAARLADAERRIEELVHSGGTWVRRPLDAPAGDLADGGAEAEQGAGEAGDGDEWM